jgi:hypothetical protein
MVKDVIPPQELYARFQKLGVEVKGEDTIASMAGNPMGEKRSWVSYIYAVEEDVVKEHQLETVYFLRVTFEWPSSAKFADETKDESGIQTYEAYKSKGYVGVVRDMKAYPCYIVFDPKYYIHSVYDMGTQTTLYSKGQKQEASPKVKVASSDSCQLHVDDIMRARIGSHYVDPRKDVFCVSEIARRKGISTLVVSKRLCKMIGRVKVHKASGCWVSDSKKDYVRMFWLALGGIDFDDIFRFPHDLTDIKSEPPVIKNNFVLHHPICEITLKEDHTRCCRPSHLRLGTSMENAYHIKIRRVIEQLFDFSPDQLKQYLHHINGIACLVQTQISTATPKEADAIRKSRRHKRVTVFTDTHGKQEVTFTGDPHIGDVRKKEVTGDGCDIYEKYMNELRKIYN